MSTLKATLSTAVTLAVLVALPLTLAPGCSGGEGGGTGGGEAGGGEAGGAGGGTGTGGGSGSFDAGPDCVVTCDDSNPGRPVGFRGCNCSATCRHDPACVPTAAQPCDASPLAIDCNPNLTGAPFSRCLCYSDGMLGDGGIAGAYSANEVLTCASTTQLRAAWSACGFRNPTWP